MKKILQKLANKYGYSINRLSSPSVNPYTAMQKLLLGIEEPIIFDVGAYHGYISLAFRKMFPMSTIYAFEPFEESFERLKANTASDQRINAFNFGLSNRNGTQAFHSNTMSGTNSLLSTDESGTREHGGKGFLRQGRLSSHNSRRSIQWLKNCIFQGLIYSN